MHKEGRIDGWKKERNKIVGLVVGQAFSILHPLGLVTSTLTEAYTTLDEKNIAIKKNEDY